MLLVGTDEHDLARYGGEGRRVAAFLGARYEETVGRAGFVARLLEKPRALATDDPDFVVIPPGGEVSHDSFLQ